MKEQPDPQPMVSRKKATSIVFLERQGRSSGHKFRVSLDTNRGFSMTRV